ncbi:hypothetical protein TraAM80_09675 [Trypanosoma rangeli]|uniref:Uncharacterized protein n=1 Tax=Trypanosoma rangeli TaxID=5698 RepID=A0A3R7MX92_TRYRA|nr:uncharacterized protein TraAM80_09675 [Trypanosoma rangeli]RNE96711.1 hypothetical protein TraAM80_09675 [Trypanosoma rangeli]|eukprot:RNE96711.1 hypothetical protein TraAM80_09675 [Trypanosoma rangeli]
MGSATQHFSSGPHALPLRRSAPPPPCSPPVTLCTLWHHYRTTLFGLSSSPRRSGAAPSGKYDEAYGHLVDKRRRCTGKGVLCSPRQLILSPPLFAQSPRGSRSTSSKRPPIGNPGRVHMQHGIQRGMIVFPHFVEKTA